MYLDAKERSPTRNRQLKLHHYVRFPHLVLHMGGFGLRRIAYEALVELAALKKKGVR